MAAYIYGEIANLIQRRAESPDGKGVICLFKLLQQARQKPEISESRPARETVDLLLEIIGDALGASSADDVFARLHGLVEAEKQRERAKRPRTRKPDPGAGHGFVAEIKAESKKRTPHSAWGWLQSKDGHKFDGFEIVSCDQAEVKYRFNDGNDRSIKAKTFARYWKEGVTKQRK